MIFYRIKQFYWALTSRINEQDSRFIKSILSIEELKLFNKLSINEQKHCVKVAYDVERICNSKKGKVDEKLLLKAALLHDIGKIHRKLNLIDKSFIVSMDRISKGKLRKFSQKQKINVYYNHSKIGVYLLKKIEYNEKLFYLIENHHNNDIHHNNLELKILKYCDKRN
ncbi:HDIG domain-containing metalloprotein [Clostridium ljungdahlii]|uniref:HDIG domain-containing metalloprotein n=1 Tax=Clostridium ljungdahlii TaxID=1538 RepID=UPI0038634597